MDGSIGNTEDRGV